MLCEACAFPPLLFLLAFVICVFYELFFYFILRQGGMVFTDRRKEELDAQPKAFDEEILFGDLRQLGARLRIGVIGCPLLYVQHGEKAVSACFLFSVEPVILSAVFHTPMAGADVSAP